MPIRTDIAVWLFLFLSTCVATWGLSEASVGRTLGIIGIFAIAAIKIRLVLLHFMELAHAPIALRLAFEAWLVGVTVLILAMWFLQAGVPT